MKHIKVNVNVNDKEYVFSGWLLDDGKIQKEGKFSALYIAKDGKIRRIFNDYKGQKFSGPLAKEIWRQVNF